jgi:hypothetical protein
VTNRDDNADREVINTAHRTFMNERHCNAGAARRTPQQPFTNGEHLATIARHIIDTGLFRVPLLAGVRSSVCSP